MKKNKSDLPKEWVELIKEAMQSNITKEDFKIFLKKEKEKRDNN
ncbi:anti-repressor SinI family protein [Bacillus sp. EB600]|nr:anti-repressor SinI family protein [Bacillus sp. EB600]MCQ6282833.1 anti-repressor SinI family protein [Bacillus sp. EB600]